MGQMERDQWQFAAWKTSGFLLSTRGLSRMCPLKSETIKIVNFNLFQRHSMDASTSVLVSGISPVLVAVSNLEIYWPHIGGCRCLCRVLWCGQSQWPRLVDGPIYSQSVTQFRFHSSLQSAVKKQLWRRRRSRSFHWCNLYYLFQVLLCDWLWLTMMTSDKVCQKMLIHQSDYIRCWE